MNRVYPSFELARGDGLDVVAVDWYVQAVDASAVFDRTDTLLSDLSGVLLGSPVALPDPAWAVTDVGVELSVDDDGLDIDSLSTSDEVGGLVVFYDDGTDRLAFWFDERADTAPLGGVSDGSTVPVSWPGSVLYRVTC